MTLTNDQITRDVMGWYVPNRDWQYYDQNGKRTDYVIFQVEDDDEIFDPLTDYNHCRLVEERIKELNLGEQYIEMIEKSVDLIDGPDFRDYEGMTSSGIFKMMMATAAQRCEAAYRAWQEWHHAQA